MPEVSIGILNGRNWTDFVDQTLRFNASDQTIGHDVFVHKIRADNVTVAGTVGGTNASSWVLRTGGTIRNSVILNNLLVFGDIDVGNNTINDVDMGDMLTTGESDPVVLGKKRFSEMHILGNAEAGDINQVHFS